MVADKNAQFALRGALHRPAAWELVESNSRSAYTPAVTAAPERSGPEMLALERSRFSHGLLVVDFEGCGTSCPTRCELEADLDSRLQSHWSEQAKAIIIEPEVDVWMGAPTMFFEIRSGGNKICLFATGFESGDISSGAGETGKAEGGPRGGAEAVNCLDRQHFIRRSRARSVCRVALIRRSNDCGVNWSAGFLQHM